MVSKEDILSVCWQNLKKRSLTTKNIYFSFKTNYPEIEREKSIDQFLSEKNFFREKYVLDFSEKRDPSTAMIIILSSRKKRGGKKKRSAKNRNRDFQMQRQICNIVAFFLYFTYFYVYLFLLKLNFKMQNPIVNE